ncbi:hypothetical protein BDP81DRAFT_432744 [Colletotrichum phormii]|uniref:Uncharacterized protein n=1 Tax=Colletotrichum phormii TaxID=359342 RepID=A0AAI9ZPH4_9PEZI|nr:uncharacterized protein BDP81DRAFT_432744 [Colletotrichum phormii]KAK1634397.1 hypothetical protein BDP81DRAFT_432744 [Colletotrichum phormii]
MVLVDNGNKRNPSLAQPPNNCRAHAPSKTMRREKRESGRAGEETRARKKSLSSSRSTIDEKKPGRKVERLPAQTCRMQGSRMRGLRRPVPDPGKADSTCFWNGVHTVQGRIETGPPSSVKSWIIDHFLVVKKEGMEIPEVSTVEMICDRFLGAC